MPRYVILAHDHPFPHWDLLLEWGNVCRTWRLLAEPVPGVATAAEPLPDHRRYYLDYEGAVSGGRGSVTRWDWGEYRVVAEKETKLSIQLQGQRGFVAAELLSNDENVGWTFHAA